MAVVRSHTYEEYHPIRYDVNFNNIHKTLLDSSLAAIILCKSEVFGDVVYDLVEHFSTICPSDLKDDIFQDFFLDIHKDVSTEGEFGKIPRLALRTSYIAKCVVQKFLHKKFQLSGQSVPS